MANYRYGRYQYETSPRKLEPEYEPIKDPYTRSKKSTIRKKEARIQTKKDLKSHVKITFYVLLIFSSLFVISYRNSLINESFNKGETLKSNLASIQKENEQLKVNLENSYNLSNIEELAKNKLGMQKLDNSQKVYVSLDKQDYVEQPSEEVVIENNQNWFEKLLNTLLGK